MRNKIVTISLAIVIAVLIAIFVGLYNIRIDYLTTYGVHPDTSEFNAEVVKYYVFNFRGGKKDIDYLDNHFGLNPLLSNPHATKKIIFEYINFFVNSGFDINTKSKATGLSLLHAAIVDNDYKTVSFLLTIGADKEIKVGKSHIYGQEEDSKMTGMDSIELTRFLSEKDSKDRSRLLKLLVES